MAYGFGDADADERHQTQYFEMFCNRGIYHQGWNAVTKHRTPWNFGHVELSFDDDAWQLYDGSSDWTQAHDLSTEHPNKLHELQRLFLIQAARANVLPLDDRQAERMLPEIAGRPTLIQGTSQTLYPGMGGLNENCVLNVKNRSHQITAEIVVPAGGGDGVLVNQGGMTGGWSLYLKDGKPTYTYSFCGREFSTAAAPSLLDAGEHQVRVEFAYDGGGLGKGGVATLYVDGDPRPRPPSNEPTFSCSHSTRPPTSDATPARRSLPTTRRATTRTPARSAGSRSISATTHTTT